MSRYTGTNVTNDALDHLFGIVNVCEPPDDAASSQSVADVALRQKVL